MKSKMLQRASSLLLAIVMIFAMVPAVTAQAEETQAELGRIVIDSYNPVPGETITVNVRLENNPGIASMRIELIYDNAVFKLTGLEYNSAMGGETNPPSDLSNYQSPFVLYWNNGGLDTNYTKDGVFATLTFQVSEEAVKGRSYTITAVYDPDEIYNGQDENVAFEVTEGKFVVYNCIAGDIDGNGKVNMRDLTVLQRYYSGWNDQVVNTPAMDVNGDGKCNSRDVTTLQRHFAGWDVTLNCACTMATCVHNLTGVAAKAATCTEEGNIAYWLCGSCGKYFADAEAKTEITYADTKLELADHAVEKVEKTEPTCTETGTIEHWKCTVCGALFADAEAKTEIKDTASAATGHTLSKVAGVEPTYTEPGVNEHWKCSVCGALFADQNGETKITENDTVIAPKKNYQIQYELYDENSTYLETIGVENRNPAYYDPEEGLLLTNLQAEGYTFDGWYDDDGKRVREIPQGTTGVVGLNAKWTPITYKLTMRDLMDDSKTIDFTAESAFELETPVWRHLTFSHWEDRSGKLTAFTDATGVARLKLEQGTIENIEVIAKWKNPINQVVNNNSDNNLIDCQYDEGAQMYWFVYEIGKIEKVILGNKEDYAAQYHSGGNHELTHTKQVSISEETGTSIAELSAATVSKSTEWGTTREAALKVSENIGMSMKTGFEAEESLGDIAKVKESIELETRIDFGVEASTGVQESQNTAETITEESSQEVCNTFVYAKTIDYSETTATQMTPDDPVGYYRNVNAATIKIYAVVIYNPDTMTCYLETYSVISDTYLYPLYEREGYVDYANDSISYKVDIAQIEAHIKSSYYVRYDGTTADGGEAMHISVHPVGQAQTLSASTYTKTGHSLVGWWETADFTGKMYLPGESVTDLAEPGKTITLYAQWVANAYTVTFDANGGTVGTSSKTVTFGETYGTLPTPARTGYTFMGWKYGNDTITSSIEVSTTDNHALVAQWAANVILDSNGGTSSVSSITLTADGKYQDLPTPTYSNSNYAFGGWYSGSTKVTNGMSATTTAHHTLKAKWVLVVWSGSTNPDGNKTIKDDGWEEKKVTDLSRSDLISIDRNTLWVTMRVRGVRYNGFLPNNKPFVEIYDENEHKVITVALDEFPKDAETQTVTFSVPTSTLSSDGKIWVRFDTGGDKWEMDWYEIYITAS